MHNLGEQLSTGKLPAGIAQTLRDGSLAKEAAEIRDHYLAETAAKFAAASQESKASLTATAEARRKAVAGDSGTRGAYAAPHLSPPWCCAGGSLLALMKAYS